VHVQYMYSSTLYREICTLFWNFSHFRRQQLQGLSDNDVTQRGEGGVLLSVTKWIIASIKMRDEGGGGVKNPQILRDVIIGQPQNVSYFDFVLLNNK
ncbi:MAG: hypothetical protein AAGK05_15415, partial [Pseudomonadota bacterium]